MSICQPVSWEARRTILSAPADGERKLFVGNDDFHAVGVFVEHHFGHFGGRQGVDDEGRGFPDQE